MLSNILLNFSEMSFRSPSTQNFAKQLAHDDGVLMRYDVPQFMAE
jgi:hypothetical protein